MPASGFSTGASCQIPQRQACQAPDAAGLTRTLNSALCACRHSKVCKTSSATCALPCSPNAIQSFCHSGSPFKGRGVESALCADGTIDGHRIGQHWNDHQDDLAISSCGATLVKMHLCQVDNVADLGHESNYQLSRKPTSAGRLARKQQQAMHWL